MYSFCCLPALSPLAAFLFSLSSHGFAHSLLNLGPHRSHAESHPRTKHRGLPISWAVTEERPVCQHRAASSGRFAGSGRLYLSNQRCVRKAAQLCKFSVKERTPQRQRHAPRTRLLQPSSGGTRLPHTHPCAIVTLSLFPSQHRQVRWRDSPWLCHWLSCRRKNGERPSVCRETLKFFALVL